MSGIDLVKQKVEEIALSLPATGSVYYYIASPYFTVQKEVYTNSRLDKRLITRHNFFTSEKRAQQFAEKILQFLEKNNE